MANEGKDGNASQFFLTLGATPELQGRNTMFGRIEGDTIYNLMKMADAELVEGEGSERPLYPAKVTGTEVVVNFFDDMVVRAREAPRTRVEAGKREVKKRKKLAGKNVLSFGGEEGEEDVSAPVLKKVKVNPKLVSTGDEVPERMSITAMPEAAKEKKSEKLRRRKSPSPAAGAEVQETPLKKSKPAKAPVHDESLSPSPEPEEITKPSSRLDKTNAEIAALKASMKRSTNTAPREKEKPKSALEALIPANSSKGRKRGKTTDERGALNLFKAFKQRLEDLPEAEPLATDDVAPPANGNLHPDQPTTEHADDEEAELCDLHFIANCQSCKSWDDPDAEAEVADGEVVGWMSHKLSFAKDTLGKDLEWKRKMEEIEVIDPREKARGIKEERRKERGKKEKGGK